MEELTVILFLFYIGFGTVHMVYTIAYAGRLAGPTPWLFTTL